MAKKLYLLCAMVLFATTAVSGQIQTFVNYNGYSIVEPTSGNPYIEVFGGGVELYELPIDGSLLTEFIMARLINHRDKELQIKHEVSPEKFWFKYRDNFPVTGSSCAGLQEIGFYSDGANGVVLEVHFNNNGAQTVTFTLTPSDSPNKKLEFEYLVSSFVDLYFTSAATIEKITGSGISKGLRFNLNY